MCWMNIFIGMMKSMSVNHQNGRPRKFFTNEELVLAKKILKYLVRNPQECVCGANNYSFGFYVDNEGIQEVLMARCMICGYRRYYNLITKDWGPK